MSRSQSLQLPHPLFPSLAAGSSPQKESRAPRRRASGASGDDVYARRGGLTRPSHGLIDPISAVRCAMTNGLVILIFHEPYQKPCTSDDTAFNELATFIRTGRCPQWARDGPLLANAKREKRQ